MIFTPSRVIRRFAALVDQVAYDLVPLEVALALARERAGERLEHADLVLARERLAVGDAGAEDDGERGDDNGPATHTEPPGLSEPLRGDGRVVAPGRVECQGRPRC